MSYTTDIDTVTQDLSLLNDIDTAKRRLEPKSPRFIELTLEAEGVRARLPADILQRYDPRIARGKRGAAKMRNGVCGGCFVSLPSGQLSDMRRDGVSLQVCGHCSILLLPEDALAVPADTAAPVAVKPAVGAVAVKKPRKSRAKVAAEVAVVEDVVEEEAAPVLVEA